MKKKFCKTKELPFTEQRRMWERAGLGSSGEFVKKACDYKRRPRPVVLHQGRWQEGGQTEHPALQLQSLRRYVPPCFGRFGQGLSARGDGGTGRKGRNGSILNSHLGWANGRWVTRRWVPRRWPTRRWPTRTWSTSIWVTRRWPTRRWPTRTWSTSRWVTRRWPTRRWVTGSSVPAIRRRMVLTNTLRCLLIAASQENLHKEGVKVVTSSSYFAVASVYSSGSPESLSERSQRLLASD